jgi:transposase-like protein
MEHLSIPDIAARIADEHAAYLFLEELRWPDGVPVCPHCGNPGANYLKPRMAEGKARATRTGSMSQRRLWQCKACRKQFSAMTGTIFHGSKVPLRTWLLVVFEMCASKNGMAAREIERKYHVAPKTAWFMAHRIREAMKRRAPRMLVGTIVSDETWIGGDPRLMNTKTRRRHDEAKAHQPNKMTSKTPVVSHINAETGEVRSAVVPDVTGATLGKAMSEVVDMGNSVLWTDEGNWYKQIGDEFAAHQTVNHSDDEYVNPVNGASTNLAEGYFSQLKRSIDGTHHHISREHLPRYLTEFDYRYSTRTMTDTARMARLMGQVDGRRLSYKRVKGS